MAPDGAGASVVWGNMAGSMSPRGVRGVLGPREEDTVPGAIDFCRDGAREKPRNGRGERSALKALFGARGGPTRSIFMILV